MNSATGKIIIYKTKSKTPFISLNICALTKYVFAKIHIIMGGGAKPTQPSSSQLKTEFGKVCCIRNF
jgi:uncharacterized protein with ACT and thioredoxin-like domain